MKIGIDARFWMESGVGRYIRNLVIVLQRLDKNNSYYIFCPSSDYEKVKKVVTAVNFTVVKVDIPWHSFKEQFGYPSFLAKYNLDLMHFPYFSLPIFYRGKFVVTIHDLILHHYSSGKASTLPLPVYKLKILGYKIVMDIAARRAKRIIAVSEATKKEIVKHLGQSRDKISVTYEGVDKEIKSITKEKSTDYFLYVGNTYPHKNLNTLLFAFSALQDTKTKLFIVGKKDYFQAQLKDKAKNEYRNPNIVFYENVDDKELAWLYENALALVSPSYMEGFGLPLVEAMGHRCVVLASDIPSAREICKDGAIYFDPKKRDDLAQKMQDVLSRKLSLEGYRKKGLARAQDFTWEKMGEETLKVYNDCLK